jgi:hypothetical protein
MSEKALRMSLTVWWKTRQRPASSMNFEIALFHPVSAEKSAQSEVGLFGYLDIPTNSFFHTALIILKT